MDMNGISHPKHQLQLFIPKEMSGMQAGPAADCC
jgi:hypothetical protein